jgi:hypothetical protein
VPRDALLGEAVRVRFGTVAAFQHAVQVGCRILDVVMPVIGRLGFPQPVRHNGEYP